MTWRWLGVFTSLCAWGCLQAEAPKTASIERDIEVTALDYIGRSHPLDELPRRPRLAIAAALEVPPQDETVMLSKGHDDGALFDDLLRAPLQQAQRDRLVPAIVAPAPDGMWLLPTSALEPGTPYTLAIATWTKDALGRPLSPDEPLLWEVRTSSDPALGAAVVSAFPADGSTGVGTNLRRAVLGLDGAVEHADNGVWLEGPDGLAVATENDSGLCTLVAPEHDATYCVVLRPLGRLAPRARHRLVVGGAARDSVGAPIGPWQASFDTGAGGDDAPPELVAQTCAIDETALEVGCALIDDGSIRLRVRADEPMLAELESEYARVSVPAPRGEATLVLSELPPATALALRLLLRDSSGNELERELAVSTSPALPAVSIVEVRADPLGAEPAQEYVELLNWGMTAVDLRGMSLDDKSDARSAPIDTDARLEPGARALLVADAFDPDDARDVRPPLGARLVRVGRSLGTSGLSNAGEALFLRDAAGRRLSAAPATPRPRPGVCLVRISADPRDGSAGAFDHDPNGSCTPGT